MVAAKAGTEMASQLSVMRIREQIDALEVMAVDPLAWLVAPRLLGIMLVLPALTIVSIFVMVGMGWVVAVFQLGLNGHTFLQLAADGVAPIDFVYGELKGLAFGLVICTVSCWYGLTCGDGPTGVGQATNRAVVTASVICVSLNYFLSELMYGGGG
jgi:phospholipid/cholesterol/gamma-HCH transport system permease protein